MEGHWSRAKLNGATLSHSRTELQLLVIRWVFIIIIWHEKLTAELISWLKCFRLALKAGTAQADVQSWARVRGNSSPDQKGAVVCRCRGSQKTCLWEQTLTQTLHTVKLLIKDVANKRLFSAFESLQSLFSNLNSQWELFYQQTRYWSHKNFRKCTKKTRLWTFSAILCSQCVPGL